MARTQIKTPGIADGSITTAKLDSSIVGALVPIGGIIMWSGTAVPTGWALCNGSNGTPNLRNRFIVAADSLTKTGTTSQSGTSPYDPGDIGGSVDATLVSHTHSLVAMSNPGNHYHTGTSGITQMGFDVGGNSTTARMDFNDGPPYQNIVYDIGGGAHTHSITLSTEGSVATDKNLPPYYALAFIMRTS